MPKLPRDLSGAQLIAALEKIGYAVTSQSGSHVRLTCPQPQEHHITIALHDPLRMGTMAAIVSDVASAQHLSREGLLHKLFG
jgi:predicted RNA binding protein YcfA (HicA-like mRNA interferase family)